jgi:MYXO-CTERM domain-containing protein
VAASTDLTGGADDGDWILERTVGRIGARAPWSREVMAAWRHRLITVSEPPDMANTIGGAPVYTLGLGANTISGSVATTADGQDNFQVAVPAGAVLSAVSLTLDTGGGFNGSVTFNLGDVRTSSGSFTSGLPAASGGGFGTGGAYIVQVVANFAIGNAWSMSFTVVSTSTPVCGNGTVEAGEACDDGNSVACDGCSSSCTSVLNGCSIGSACIAEGTLDPANPCRACQRGTSRTMYTPVAAGVSCDDGLHCTVATSCNGGGACTGSPRDCGDGLDCTTDSCDETADACVHPLTSGCLIGGACIADGALDPSNACMACAPGSSTSVYSPAAVGSACDDALFCTVTDACDGAGTCEGTARDCSDGSDCTADSCDEGAGACASEPIAGCMPDAGPDGGADAGMLGDAGTDVDASVGADASVSADAGTDGGADVDGASIAPDAALPDGGAVVEAGGCGCRFERRSSSAGPLLLAAVLALALRRRRRRG